MRKHDSTPFPIGTVILKQKLADAASRQAILYTGMLKRETSYNPECGNWEFFTITGGGEAVTSRGRMESCMDCHKQYSRSDFVTKGYPMRSRGSVLR
jgi:hypothetical protein